MFTQSKFDFESTIWRDFRMYDKAPAIVYVLYRYDTTGQRHVAV